MPVFSLEHRVDMSASETRNWAVVHLGHDLGYARFRLTDQARDQLVFTRRHRGLGVWLLTIITFPVGLIAFYLGGSTHRITVLVAEQRDDYTDLVISGDAPPRAIEGVRHRMITDLAADV